MIEIKSNLTAARQKATLFTVESFAALMNIVFTSIDDWSRLSPPARAAFINSIISPYELRALFEPSFEPIVESTDIEELKRSK